MAAWQNALKLVMRYNRQQLFLLNISNIKTLFFSPSLLCVISGFAAKQSEISRLESCNKLLTEELTQAKSTNETLAKTLEDTQDQNKVHKHFA